MNTEHTTHKHTPTSEAVLATIKQRHIAPIPRWRFVMLNIGMWSSGVAAVIVGSIGVCMSIVVLTDAEWPLLIARPHPQLNIIRTLPYLWVILLLVFVYLAHRFIRHTRHGYAYASVYILAAAVSVSMCGGAVLYASGVGHAVVEFVDDHRPPFHAMLIPQYAVWEDPQDGLLRGVVVRVISTAQVDVKDPRGEIWNLDISHAQIGGALSKNTKIHAVGEVSGDRLFIAEQVIVMPRTPMLHPPRWAR